MNQIKGTNSHIMTDVDNGLQVVGRHGGEMRKLAHATTIGGLLNFKKDRGNLGHVSLGKLLDLCARSEAIPFMDK